MRIHALHFGIAGGVTVGLGVLVLTLIAIGTGHGLASAEFFSFYPGYDLSNSGAAVGFLWGFVDGFVGFGFMAWIYNKIHAHKS